ncbi:hypothetical protein GEMRC1_006222 [Eukaryota sp. GEM-RC1]
MLVITLGDSLTSGYTFPGRDDMDTPYGSSIVLPDSYNASVLILAVSGYTISQISSMVVENIFKEAEIVILMGGTNDIAQNSSIDDVVTRFSYLMDKIFAMIPSSSKLLILELPPIRYSGVPSFTEEVNEKYQTLCSRRRNCQFVTWFEEISGDLVDGFHLDGEGYKRLGAYLSKIIINTEKTVSD